MVFKDNQPIYLQIADWACERMLLGHWPPGEKIPSVRELGVSVQVNPNTVVRAYDILEQKSIIANRRGVGYFVEVDAVDRIKNFRREQFLAEDLPILFRNLQLLEIPITEIAKRYEQYLSAQKKPL